MEELFHLNLSESTIEKMMTTCPKIKNMTNMDIKDKIYLLKEIGCSQKQITHIICYNPKYLENTHDKTIKILQKLVDVGFKHMNTLLDANPMILNLEPLEFEQYIYQRLEFESLEEIIIELEENPKLFNTI